VLEQLGIREAFVLGTSQGGFIGVRMALLDPGAVKGVIALGTSMDYESAGSRDLGCWDGIAFGTPSIEGFAGPARGQPACDPPGLAASAPCTACPAHSAAVSARQRMPGVAGIPGLMGPACGPSARRRPVRAVYCPLRYKHRSGRKYTSDLPEIPGPLKTTGPRAHPASWPTSPAHGSASASAGKSRIGPFKTPTGARHLPIQVRCNYIRQSTLKQPAPTCGRPPRPWPGGPGPTRAPPARNAA
jgi:pimeloyl-ACP methyl ester carboxylesterase